MSKKETTALAKPNEMGLNQIRESVNVLATQMQEMGIESEDLVITQLLLQQNTSKAVSDEKAALGDVLNSQTNEIVGSLEQPFEIIPLRMNKTIRIYDQSAKPRPRFIREEPADSENKKLPFEGTEVVQFEGAKKTVPIRRYLNYNFFVLLKKDIDNNEAFPLLIRFKSTSMNAGKLLATHMIKMLSALKKPYSQTVKITVHKEKKDTNAWAVFGIEKGNTVPDKDIAIAQKWVGDLLAMQYRVHEREEESDDQPAPKAPTVVQSTQGSEEGPY